MEVILKEDIINLGFKDDIVTVKDGYGRNYLIPQKKAVIASESAKKMLAEELRQRAHKLEAIKQEAQALGEKIDGIHLEIKAKTSKYGVIFGSVTNIQLAEALAEKGFEIDRKIIQIKKAVKEVGDYDAQVRLHRDVIVPITFTVISENHAVIESETPAPAPAPAAEAPAEEGAETAEAPEAPEAQAEETATAAE
ncbi:MAG: 50S ribosomal protein L9 [Porphyromonas sp.]|uniref:50S ribosomal protein L9 n=1 Tax=Porphyromonas sp. TaxID=1924944 RepID=UPI002A762AE2|nr:50S ribosomal protein L9 [Porphyromonas sp.]MDD6929019.1 50S ribosomal protein L9 [Bacteroidales bacterium]MDY3111737.1 50S ribosomal protein L9 [Porphyromonas sp.]MDY4244929.1 50S ribosomal protein L9 [Porphyromonas sp.]